MLTQLSPCLRATALTTLPVPTSTQFAFCQHATALYAQRRIRSLHMANPSAAAHPQLCERLSHLFSVVRVGGETGFYAVAPLTSYGLLFSTLLFHIAAYYTLECAVLSHGESRMRTRSRPPPWTLYLSPRWPSWRAPHPMSTRAPMSRTKGSSVVWRLQCMQQS